MLIENGADKDASDNDGFTALICAAHKGHTDYVRLLVDGGADKDAANSDGGTALIWAARRSHNKCARLLSEFGLSNCCYKAKQSLPALI